MNQKYRLAPVVLKAAAIGTDSKEYRWVLHPGGFATIHIQFEEKPGYWLETTQGFWVGCNDDVVALDEGQGWKVANFLEAREEALTICKHIYAL